MKYRWNCRWEISVSPLCYGFIDSVIEEWVEVKVCYLFQRLSCIASSSDTPSSSTASPLSMPSPMPMDLSLLLKVCLFDSNFQNYALFFTFSITLQAQFSTPLPTPIIQPERQTSSTQDGGLTSVVDHIENLPVDLEVRQTQNAISEYVLHSQLPSSSTSAHSFDTDPIDQLQQLLLPTSSVQGDSISLDLTEEGEPQVNPLTRPGTVVFFSRPAAHLLLVPFRLHPHRHRWMKRKSLHHRLAP